MNNNIFTNAEVESIFENYPPKIRNKLLNLRKIIFETAKQSECAEELEETLRWGEPSYITKKGSTFRMDWKPTSPNQYAMYFQCNSLLVPTFKKIYPHDFHYEGNRAIVFGMNDKIPIVQLKNCIKMALTYHSIKKSLGNIVDNT
ncbi:DUF1801 domain-containing protein [Leptospira sp. GIMC2001]|uniref:DUF1801 domain-containing protein n=1 Tax=Leptospira sp. GIMC2001 TaxID=1513297 RepID=UPI00234A4A48|nr:DUF1801 domain-containing protein [Leptospira sp. GIMC2001]WCL49201.1 DUF1801 domain-containing protein [Leptospira sp. GIMC2001]